MHDKTVFITGGTTGVGKGAAERLLVLGARVVLLARNVAKAEAVCAEWMARYPGSRVAVIPCDLASLESVSEAVRRIQEKFIRVDVLINAAGRRIREKALSVDGIDLSFATHHLGHFALTTALLDFMPPGARILNVSSETHKFAWSFEDPLFEIRRYTPWRALLTARLCALLFTASLAETLRDRNIRAFALHGGLVRSGIAHDGLDQTKWAYRLLRLFGIDPTVGATTAVFLASSPEVDGQSGRYFKARRAVAASELARDTTVAQKLWTRSTQLLDKFKQPPRELPAG